MKFFTTRDDDERLRVQVLAAAVRDLTREYDQERARMIANEVGKMLGG